VPGIARVRREEDVTVLAFSLSAVFCHCPWSSRDNHPVNGVEMEENNTAKKT
jgi:hypothetical protein